MERLLVEIQGMRAEWKLGFQEMRMELGELRRTGRGLARDVGKLADHFIPLVGPEEEAEKEQEGSGLGMEKDTEKDAEEAAEEMDSTLQES